MLALVSMTNRTERSPLAPGPTPAPARARGGQGHQEDGQYPQQQQQPAADAQTAGLSGLDFVKKAQIAEGQAPHTASAEEMDDDRQGRRQRSRTEGKDS